MNPFQAQLIYKYNDHLFIDGTFNIESKSSYQVITIRIHNIFEETYYTVGYALISDKSMSKYIELLRNIYTKKEKIKNLKKKKCL